MKPSNVSILCVDFSYKINSELWSELYCKYFYDRKRIRHLNLSHSCELLTCGLCLWLTSVCFLKFLTHNNIFFAFQVGWAHQKCRSCFCDAELMQQHFRDEHFSKRSLRQHNYHCDILESAATPESQKDLEVTYGIVERSLISKLSEFDITTQLPQDIMHVLLEGSVQYEVRYILQHYIDTGVIKLVQLNSSFEKMYLGYPDERNRPPPLKNAVFNGQEKYKLKQTAKQARIYIKHLPFCLNPFVQCDNLHFQLLLQLISIVCICFSPVISMDTIAELKNTIEMHLSLFK